MKRTIIAMSGALAVLLSPPIGSGMALAAIFELHYAPEENLERVDVRLIDQAAARIDVAAYVLTDVAVIDALSRAAARGVKIRLFLEPFQERDSGYAAQKRAALAATPGVEIKRSLRNPWMHLKSYLVDGKTLRMGAANFSASGLKQQDNDLMVTDDAGAIAAFQKHFETMWRRPSSPDSGARDGKGD